MNRNENKQNLKRKLNRAIQRTEKAYSAYIVQKKYFQALRIKKANEVLYNLLQEYLFECEESDVEDTLQFIFHLEDWKNQFDSKQIRDLNEVFVFERYEDSPSYPKKFTDKIKKETQ